VVIGAHRETAHMSVDPHLESIPEQPAVDGARRLLSDLMALVLALSSYWGVIEPTDPAWINAVVVAASDAQTFPYSAACIAGEKSPRAL